MDRSSFDRALAGLGAEDLAPPPAPPAAVWDAIADELEDDDLVSQHVARVLADVDEAELELIEPPPAIWERISATIESGPRRPEPPRLGHSRVPPARHTPTPLVVEYAIDAEDVVTPLGDDWASFAEANDAPELSELEPDRTLWSYFDSDATRELWQLVVERVRAVQAPAEIPIRCDGPRARRWFTMTVTPRGDGSVHFRSELAFEEERPAVSFLERHAERDVEAEPVPLCSWCGSGQIGGLWLDVEALVRANRLLEETTTPPVVHGICSTCRDDMGADLIVPSERSHPQT